MWAAELPFFFFVLFFFLMLELFIQVPFVSEELFHLRLNDWIKLPETFCFRQRCVFNLFLQVPSSTVGTGRHKLHGVINHSHLSPFLPSLQGFCGPGFSSPVMLLEALFPLRAMRGVFHFCPGRGVLSKGLEGHTSRRWSFVTLHHSDSHQQLFRKKFRQLQKLNSLL